MENTDCMHLHFGDLTRHHSCTYNWSKITAVLHQHVDFYELGLISQGSYIQHFEGESTVFEAGTLYLFNIGQTHSMTIQPPEAIHFNVVFQKQYFELLLQLFSFGNVFENKNLIYIKLPNHAFEYLLSICNALSAGQQESSNIKLLFYNSLSLLTKETVYSADSADIMVDDILEKIRNYTYLASSVQDIYKNYPYSPPTIIKRFKQRTGMTIIQFQTHIKLDCAARIIRETTQPIDQIAANLGFLSTSHFYEIFKARFELTPTAYRAKYKIGSN
ncbi:MAG: AraC family transcriptional regulator [Oscillospiraceae bacterium]|nr:AraC family transcriptional regulator [Oscillospiraceae bacterium]